MKYKKEEKMLEAYQNLAIYPKIVQLKERNKMSILQ